MGWLIVILRMLSVSRQQNVFLSLRRSASWLMRSPMKSSVWMELFQTALISLSKTVPRTINVGQYPRRFVRKLPRDPAPKFPGSSKLRNVRTEFSKVVLLSLSADLENQVVLYSLTVFLSLDPFNFPLLYHNISHN